ncbi:unnamed protein product [Schistosoma mattheei]|uniref:Uncharacterized protein n=1 Tax=Schistosoma mattheei TaxID=31246 RepID=A0A183PMA6_9TREM|nr:unnamed protein product [Schistosoma mattheei]
MQEKMTSVVAASVAVGLNIHKGKSKILRYNIPCASRVTLGGEALEDVKTFTYLDSMTDEHGTSDANLKARIGKAGAAYPQLKNICNSKKLATNTKVRIFNTNVKTVLLYGGGNQENYESYHSQDTSVYQQLYTQNTQYRLLQTFINDYIIY